MPASHHKTGVSSGKDGHLFSLRKKLLISFGGLFAVALFVIELMGLYGLPFSQYEGRYRAQKAEVYQALESQADSKKVLLQCWLSERRADVNVFSQDEAFSRAVEGINLLLVKNHSGTIRSKPLRERLALSGDWQWLSRRLREIAASHSNDTIDVISMKNGVVIASSRDEHVGDIRISDQGFRDAATPLYDEVIRTGVDKNGRYRLFISRPMNRVGSQEYEAIAVITINTDLDAILRPMVNAGLAGGGSSEVILANSDGQSLTSLRYPKADGTPVRPLADFLRMKPVSLAVAGGEGIVAADDYRGLPVLAAYRHIRLSGDAAWGMVVKIDQKEAFAQLDRNKHFIMAVGAVGFMLVLLLTWIISDRLARPISLLHQAAKKIHGGDLTVRADVQSNDEVGALAMSFNGMVAQIQGWHEELEAQVCSRTEQLESSNRNLVAEMMERKLAVESLLQSESRFRELLETIQMVAVTLDPSGKVTFCNDYLLNITGWRREEVLGASWFDRFIPPDAVVPVLDAFVQSVESGKIVSHFENQIVTREGKRRNIVWDNTILHNMDNSVAGVASIGVDVTDHRSVEEQLRHSQKMEAIGRLAGGVAHDFNNMLGVILGYAELCMLTVPAESVLWQRINEISKAAQRSSEITRQLLAFSRKEIIAPRTVNLNVLIVETEKALGRLIGEDVKLRFKPATALWPVKADPSQIYQILINLAVNARDAMPDGGDLIVETANMRVDEAYCHNNLDARPGAFVRVSVSDTGFGMDDETRKHIFEPFFTTKAVGKGTGLGLATIYGIITQNNGFINVDSEPGVGSTFHIYLPRTEEDCLEEALQAIPSVAGSATVLLVEDDRTVLEMTKAMLEQIGYTVISAGGPEEAITLCGDTGNKVDIVITDVIMPVMSGKEMVERIVMIRPGIKVLYMSGYTSDIIAQKGVLEEGTHFLQKPFTMNDLKNKVEELC